MRAKKPKEIGLDLVRFKMPYLTERCKGTRDKHQGKTTI
jgi:hypothetical protein